MEKCYLIKPTKEPEIYRGFSYDPKNKESTYTCIVEGTIEAVTSAIRVCVRLKLDV